MLILGFVHIYMGGLVWSTKTCFHKSVVQSHTDDQPNISHLYASQKNRFKTTYELTVLSSMKNLFPNLFGKGSSDGMDTSKSLPSLADVDKWSSKV